MAFHTSKTRPWSVWPAVCLLCLPPFLFQCCTASTSLVLMHLAKPNLLCSSDMLIRLLGKHHTRHSLNNLHCMRHYWSLHLFLFYLLCLLLFLFFFFFLFLFFPLHILLFWNPSKKYPAMQFKHSLAVMVQVLQPLVQV